MYKISYVEIRGTYHKAYDIPCQDKTNFTKNKDYACVALADGAGSRRFSHFGAELTVNTVCDYFDKHDSISTRELCTQIRNNLSESDYVFDDLASTLLFVFVKNNKAIIGHLGDGIIIGVKNNCAEILSYPENGEDKNITYFTTDANILEHFRVKEMSISDISEMTFILASDGGETLLYNSKTNTIAKAATTMASWLSIGDEYEINEALINNIGSVAKKYTSDDVSIIQLQVKR